MNTVPKLKSGFRLAACLGVLTVAAACGDQAAAPGTTQQPAQSVPTGLLSGTVQNAVDTLLGSTLSPGVQVNRIQQGEVALLLLEIDPQRLEPVLLGAPEKGLSASQAIEQYDLDIVIGSGFVSELHSLQPVGLLQVSGTTLSPVQGHGYTRILGINDQGMGVVHKATYQRDLFHSALQVGPGIIEDGTLDISERDLQRPKYFRSFLALCRKRWIAGVSLRPTHLRTLGQVLLEHFLEQGWQCSEVVNLAGDRQAVALMRSTRDEIFFHGDPHTYKVSLLGFRPR